MAKSPAHRFGQVIGSLLEEILESSLREFCQPSGLFLDRKGLRTGVRPGKKVTWRDKYENVHDLDFVIERSPSATERGRPVAFIEAAWRRYTKHSRNKAQEIQGAVAPLAETHARDAPFLGVVLAGEFTSASLNQLRSHGFHLIHYSYRSVIDAFAKVGVDARFDEDTPHDRFIDCVSQIEALSEADRGVVKAAIVASEAGQMKDFFASLKQKIDRLVEQVIVVPLFGQANQFSTIASAASFIGSYDGKFQGGDLRKIEIIVRFSSGDKIEGSFGDIAEALHFLSYIAG